MRERESVCVCVERVLRERDFFERERERERQKLHDITLCHSTQCHIECLPSTRIASLHRIEFLPRTRIATQFLCAKFYVA